VVVAEDEELSEEEENGGAVVGKKEDESRRDELGLEGNDWRCAEDVHVRRAHTEPVENRNVAQ